MTPVGAVLILLAGLSAAWRLTREQDKRLRALRSLALSLQHLHAELSLRLTSLPELAELLAQTAQGTAGRFFSTLYEKLQELGEKSFVLLWQESAQSALPELSGEDRAIWLRLGETLGRYELEEQLSAIELCRAELEYRAKALAEALPGRKRLAYGLLGTAGALLSIILLS